MAWRCVVSQCVRGGVSRGSVLRFSVLRCGSGVAVCCVAEYCVEVCYQFAPNVKTSLQ